MTAPTGTSTTERVPSLHHLEQLTADDTQQARESLERIVDAVARVSSLANFFSRGA